MNKIKFPILFSILLTLFLVLLYEQHEQKTENVNRNAKIKVEELLRNYKSFRSYISKQQKKEVYNLQAKKIIDKEYFHPTLLSSTYGAKNVNILYNKAREKEGLEPITLRFASNNPRNPNNLANKDEAILLKYFNENRQIKKYSNILNTKNGTVLYYAIPTKVTTKTCIKCHSDPKLAPKELVKKYGNKAGFYEKNGNIRAIMSVQYPLDDDIDNAKKDFWNFATLATFIFFILLLIIYNLIKTTDNLQKQQLLINSLAELQNNLLVVLDENKNMIFSNNSFLKFFEISNLNEFKDKHQSIECLFLENEGYFVSDINSNWLEQIQNIEKNQRIVMMMNFQIFAPQAFLVSIRKIEKTSNIVIIFTEITDMATAKTKATKDNKAKSEFLANMSHEIRTPLNAINGFIDLLKEESIGKKALGYVNIIDDSSKNLLKIIEDILDFSKIESGKLEIDKINFDTKKEFGIISHLFEAKCSQKNISLVLNLNENLPKIINTDPLRIKQIIANLLSNAVKFTKSGKKIIIDINYENNNLFVSVKDEGIGIAENKLEHIFEAFSQEDTSTTRKYGGTGLGLSISNKLVNLLGGELKVKSTIKKGSKFYFYIPVEIGKNIEDKKDDNVAINFKNKKILVVEDNQANQMFMKIILKKIHIETEIANDGIEAIKAFKNKKYDAILMDENMPNMNGIEATKKILEYEKQNNLIHTPIIALTANALKGDRERFLEAGMDEYLSKPVSKKDLKNILNLLICK